MFPVSRGLPFAVLLLFALPVYGQGDVEDDLVEAPGKYRQSIFWSPSAVSVITWDDILLSGAVSLPDLLRRIPGFDMYDMKPYYPVLGARGMTDNSNSRILMLVDGREENIDLAGFALWGALTFDLEEVQRIEIIRGPASTLYGANAVTAVVSITTIEQEPTSDAEVFVSGGELGRLRLYMEYSDVWRQNGSDLSCGIHTGVEGKRSLSDARDQPLAPQLHGHVRYRRPESLDISLHLGLSGGEGLVFIDPGDLGFKDALVLWIMSKGRFFFAPRASLSSQLYYTHGHSDFIYRTAIWAYDSWIADVARLYWSTNIVDGKTEVDLFVSDALRLIAGIHLRFYLLDCTGVDVDDDDELRGAAFAQLEWRPWQPGRDTGLRVTGGVRVDLNLDVEPAVSPRLALVYRPWSDQAFRLGYSSAFRKPTDFESRMHLRASDFNPATPEVLDMMARSFGNSGLVNEVAHSIEGGWRGNFASANLDAGASLFFSMHRDTMNLVIDMPERLGLPNLRNTNIRYENNGIEYDVLGAEAELGWYPHEDLVVWGNLSWSHAFDNSTGERITAQPRLRINLGGGYRPAFGLFIDTAVHYVSAYTSTLVVPSDPILGREEHNLGNTWLLIGNLGYRFCLRGTRFLDAGLSIRQPLAVNPREIAGAPIPLDRDIYDVSDFGGEKLTRQIWAYVRWSY